VVSGNENKIDLTSGVAVVVRDAAPDSLTFLDFSEFPPRVQHLPDLSNSVIGPPSNLAITPDHRMVLVADSVKIDPADPGAFVPESIVHLIDLQAAPPVRIGQVRVGRQPSGLSITEDGRHALVANRADGTISVLGIDGWRVEPLQTMEVCPPDASLSDVAIHSGTGRVLASAQKGGYLAVLQFAEGRLTDTGRRLSVYGQPYRCLITPDGRLGLTAGQGFGNGLDADALSVIDLSTDPMRTVDYVALGAVPESIDVSPKGDWVAAVTMNGSNLAPDSPLYHPRGRLMLLSRQGTRVTAVQEVDVGAIPEGVVFTSDGRYLVVQCHPARELWVFELERGRLVDTGLRISVPGMPASLRAAP